MYKEYTTEHHHMYDYKEASELRKVFFRTYFVGGEVFHNAGQNGLSADWYSDVGNRLAELGVFCKGTKKHT